MIPRRPRLAEWIFVRRQIVGAEPRILAHDAGKDETFELTSDEWELVQLCDGTRDTDGVALAAAREGVFKSASALGALLEKLAARGALAEGNEPPVVREGKTTPPDRPLEALPHYTFVCDGRGSCCRLYSAVVFSADDADRARTLGIGPSLAFTPLRGGIPRGPRAAPQIDGACAFHDPDAGCRIHAAAGAQAKPNGCRVFPATYVDDGESVRVSVSVECACVTASVGREDAEPLVPPSARVSGDLPGAAIGVLPQTIRVDGARTVDRSELARWSRSLEVPDADAAAFAWGLAAAIEGDGLSASAEPALDETEARRWIDAATAHAGAVSAKLAPWQGDRSLAMRVIAAIGGANVAIATRSDERERFYLRASIFGHAGVANGPPIATLLRDRAIRILLARAIADEADPMFRDPLPLVEAVMRNYRLRAYTEKL